MNTTITPPTRRDRYTIRPYLLLTPALLLVGSNLIFDQGGLLPSPSDLLAMLLFLMTIIYWLCAITYAIFLGLWKRLLSVVTGGLFAFAFACLFVRFGDEIHFQIMRSSYIAEIRHGFPNVKEKFWVWDSGSNYTDVLYYERTTPAPNSGLLFEDSPATCETTIKKMSGHFYLQSTVCF